MIMVVERVKEGKRSSVRLDEKLVKKMDYLKSEYEKSFKGMSLNDSDIIRMAIVELYNNVKQQGV